MTAVAAIASPPSTDPRARTVVRVPVTTVWVDPERPRAEDLSMITASPDVAEWLATMDAAIDPQHGRLGLHDRALTQLVEGEPVTVSRVVETEQAGAWSQILAPWQPAPGSLGGYPGWVPSAHLRVLDDHPWPDAGPPSPPGGPDTRTDRPEHPALALAREHLGLKYLWGGLTPLGFDCSGLVHHTWRRLGVVVPRDAYAQAEAARPVALDEVRPGDLYFFAHPARRIHHVGIAVSRGRMLHASETGGVLVEEELAPDRLETLVAAGRLCPP